MKKIEELIKNYNDSIQKIESSKLKQHEELKCKIESSKNHLQQLREYVRSTSFCFKSIDEEVLFFKIIKPKIRGNVNFFLKKLEYRLEKPTTSTSSQKKYIQKELRKLELKKKKNISFYRYQKQEENAFDEMYFTRRKERLELFNLSEFIDTDVQFTTSHDLLACEVVTYDLLTEFYKQELYCLNNLENGFYDTSNINEKLQASLSWTANKTDLIELIYALKISGAINNGDISVKELMGSLGEFLNIDLINYYKTYSEIRNRNKDQAKFLTKLSLNLQYKLEKDEI